jgi:DNA-binding response OmpR family regulator
VRIAAVEADPLLVERMRASLAGSPLCFLPVRDAEAAAAADADLLLVPASSLAPGRRVHAVPVIAHGPAQMLRSAFLAGCDDYLREPWTTAELSARALAVLGRVRERFTFPWGTLEIRGETLHTPAGPLRLGAIQSRLLKKLLASRGEPVPREALALCAWGRPARAESRALDVHVAAIRGKLAAALPAAGPRFIVAVRGRGYMVS